MSSSNTLRGHEVRGTVRDRRRMDRKVGRGATVYGGGRRGFRGMETKADSVPVRGRVCPGPVVCGVSKFIIE